MRIALCGDSHGFAPALEAALSACRATGPDLTLFLGDLLTCPFSPDPPSESIQILQATKTPLLRGNHDLLIAVHGTPEWENAMSMRSVRGLPSAGRWIPLMPKAAARLDATELEWIRQLPDQLTFEGGVIHASHGLPGNPFLSVDGIDPRETALVDVRAAAFEQPDVTAASLVVCGHNHVPMTTVRGNQMVVRAAAATGWGHQVGVERFGGYAVITRRGATWEVEHKLFEWRPRDPDWSWIRAVEEASA